MKILSMIWKAMKIGSIVALACIGIGTLLFFAGYYHLVLVFVEIPEGYLVFFACLITEENHRSCEVARTLALG